MKTNLLKIIAQTLIVALMVLFTSTSYAQSISNVTIPSGATSCTNTIITVDATQLCINYTYLGPSQSVVGNTLFLNMDWSSPGPICLGALAFVQENFVFGSLPAGVNIVEVRTFLDGVQQNILVNNITVTGCCTAAPSFTANVNNRCTADSDTFLFTNTSTGATSQEWYVNNTLTSTAVDFAPGLTAPGNYDIKLKVTDGSCSDSTIQTVNVYPSPIVDLGADIQSCFNTFETLDAGAGFPNYDWSSTASNSPTINVTNTDFYNVVVTSNDGCEGTDTIHVTFNPLPVVDLGNDTAVCENNTILLDAGSYDSYSWNTLDTTQTLEAGPLGGVFGVYEVEVTDSFGCQNSDDIALTFLAAPLVDLGSDSAEICMGDSILLDAGTHNDYNWNTGETTQSIAATLNQLYFVTVSNTDNCTASDSVYVDVLTGPIVNLGNDTTICFGDNISFDAGTFASYSWPDNSTMQTFALDSNMYSLGDNTIAIGVTDADGCSGSGVLTLEVIDCDTLVNGLNAIGFEQRVLVYPNPTIDLLQIDIAASIDNLNLALIDLSGKVILSNNYENIRSLQLNLAGLDNGLYFLVLKNGDKMEIRKISKK